MQKRIKKLYSWMERESLDAVLVTLPKHIYYLTGFYTEPHKRFLALVLQRGEEPFLLVPALDLEKAQQSATISRIYAHLDTENPFQVLCRHLAGTVNRLGLEEEHITVDRFRALQDATGAREIADMTLPLREMRMIKDPEEIAVMKRAIAIIEEVFRAGLKQVKPGVAELEIVAEMEYQMRKLGAEGPSFSTMVLSGKKAGQPHGVPGTDPIRQGELLLIDAGVFLDGYASDLTRTFAVGDLDERLTDMYEAVRAANAAAIAAVRPGRPYAEIDRAARDVITAKGYGDYFITRTGHGLGLEIHEYPSIHGHNLDLIQPGMTFTIEPGIYHPTWGGIRIEDNVWVTADGAEVLTTFPRELQILS